MALGLLIVDDEEGVRRALERALSREAYHIYLAADGPTAIQIVERNAGDIAIAISDYKMPGVDGLQTLAAIGQLNPEITRIMLTGYATLESAIAATNEGIDGFLTKPFDNLELRAKIREHFVRKRLKQFVSTQVLDEIQRDPSKLVPHKQRATILFTDIRGFTPMAEETDPIVLAALLSDSYFGPLGEVAFNYGGTLDKHIGDSIMVIFGAPLEHPDDPLRAVQCAIDMRAAMLRHNQNAGAQQRIPMGIGIHTGEVVAGLLGSPRKREYTAIGGTVNVASRLEKYATDGQILITTETYAAVQDRIDVEALPPLTVRGISQPIDVYNVLRLRD
jgi:adenylate cyclase